MLDRVHSKIRNKSEIDGNTVNHMGSRTNYLMTDDQIIQRIESRVYAQPNMVNFTDANVSEPSTKFMLVSRTSMIDMSESYISIQVDFTGAPNNSFIVPNLGHPLITSLNVRINNTEIFNAQNYELISGFLGNFYGAYQYKSEIMGVLAGTPAVYSQYPDAVARDYGIVNTPDAAAGIQAAHVNSEATLLSRQIRSRIVKRNGTTPVIRELRIYLSSIPIFNEIMHSSDFPLFAVDNLEINLRFAALQKCFVATTNANATAALGNAITARYSNIMLVLSQKIVSDVFRSSILMRLESGILIAAPNVDYRSGTPDASNNLQIVVVPNLSHVLAGFVFFSKRGAPVSSVAAYGHTEIYYPFGVDNNGTTAIYQEQETGATQVRFSVGGVLVPQYPISTVEQRVSNAYDALKASGIDTTGANYEQIAFEKPIYGISMLKSASPKAMVLSGVNLSRGLSFEAVFTGGTAYTAANLVNVQYNVLLSYLQLTELFMSGPIVSR